MLGWQVGAKAVGLMGMEAGADGAKWLEMVGLELGLWLVALVRLVEMLGLVGLGLQLHPAPAPAPNNPGGQINLQIPPALLNPVQAPFASQRPSHSPALFPDLASDPALDPAPVPDPAPDLAPDLVLAQTRPQTRPVPQTPPMIWSRPRPGPRSDP